MFSFFTGFVFVLLWQNGVCRVSVTLLIGPLKKSVFVLRQKVVVRTLPATEKSLLHMSHFLCSGIELPQMEQSYEFCMVTLTVQA